MDIKKLISYLLGLLIGATSGALFWTYAYEIFPLWLAVFGTVGIWALFAGIVYKILE